MKKKMKLGRETHQAKIKRRNDLSGRSKFAVTKNPTNKTNAINMFLGVNNFFITNYFS